MKDSQLSVNVASRLWNSFEVEHAPVEAYGPRLVVLEIRSRVLERGVDIPAVEGIDCGADDLDVLLRHGPRSISLWPWPS